MARAYWRTIFAYAFCMGFVKGNFWSRAAMAAIVVFGGIALCQAQATIVSTQGLAAKKTNLTALNAKATNVTKAIGDLAKTGKLPTSDEGIALLKKMVEELEAIHLELQHQQAEIDELKKAQEGPTNKELASQVKGLSTVKPNGFEQFEFRRSTEPGKETSLFANKRTRMGLVGQFDKTWGFKLTADFAANANSSTTKDSVGDTVNQPSNGNSVITKDVFVTYKGQPGGLPPVDATIGQFALPLGYELSRSDVDREMAERALYNRTMFAGERARGFNVKLSVAPGLSVNGGLVDALTTEDAEQINVPAGPSGRLAGIAGIRYTRKNYSVGLSGLEGERPLYLANGAPGVDRKFAFADVNVKNLLGGKAEFRGEAMVGKDRAPGSTAAVPSNLSGYQMQLGYWMDKKNRLDVRFEGFNPNNNVSNKGVRSFGVAYNMFITDNVKLQLSQSSWTNSAYASSTYRISTVRLQVKF